MNFNSESLRALDAHYFFSGLENLALIALIIIGVRVLVTKTNWFTKKLKNITWVVVTLLSIAIAAQYTADLFNYVHAIRQIYTEERHRTTGL